MRGYGGGVGVGFTWERGGARCGFAWETGVMEVQAVKGQ